MANFTHSQICDGLSGSFVYMCPQIELMRVLTDVARSRNVAIPSETQTMYDFITLMARTPRVLSRRREHDI